MKAVLAWRASGQEKMRYMLCASAVLSLALHATVLSMCTSSVAPKHAANTAVGSAVASMHVRAVRTHASLSPLLAVHAPLLATGAPHASGHAPILKEEPSAIAPPTPPASTTTEVEVDNYIPRSQLSTPPIALTTIVLEPPSGEPVGDRLVGILLLFIDEQGHVDQVDSEEPILPPAFEQAAREAFIAAEFSPGEIDGRAVKSRLRVEVVFDDTSPSMR
ncbi:MAG: hypothetical protein V4645_31060 [Pseudomonadota bacterium]